MPLYLFSISLGLALRLDVILNVHTELVTVRRDWNAYRGLSPMESAIGQTIHLRFVFSKWQSLLRGDTCHDWNVAYTHVSFDRFTQDRKGTDKARPPCECSLLFLRPNLKRRSTCHFQMQRVQRRKGLELSYTVRCRKVDRRDIRRKSKGHIHLFHVRGQRRLAATHK